MINFNKRAKEEDMNSTIWDREYTSGNFRYMWDLPYPSQELVSFIATTNFSRKNVALDIGCGAVREAIFLAQQGFNTIGIDLSKEALKIASERAMEEEVQIDWRHGNVLNLPVEDKSVDFINDRGCFHTVSENERDQFAREMDRVLKPGGMMLLRGCDDKEEDGQFIYMTEQKFTYVTKQAIEQHFDKYFDYGRVLPIQIATGVGYSIDGMKGNIVVLKK